MATLQEIRAKLKQQEEKSSGAQRGAGDTSIYPFWNAKEGNDSVIRFLPDSNENNTFFWVERLMINLPFSGVKGQADSREVTVKVPCMEMYGETCPIISETRPWWDDKSLEDLARKYWKKRSYFFQGFVVEDGVKEEQSPENPIRKFIIGPQLFKLIKSALLDPELDNMPTDVVDGIDFRVVKTGKGNYSDYSTSKWSRRSRPLADNELDSLEKYGLYDLGSLLPPKPSAVELQVIKEMFAASVDGEAYDPERWGKYFKPAGTGSDDVVSFAEPAAPVAKISQVVEKESIPEVNDDDTDAPWDAPVSAKSETASANRAEDILARIRSRQQAQ